MNIDRAVVYDIETYPNVFTLAVENFKNNRKSVWQIAPWRDDRRDMLSYLQYLAQNQDPMIGFNNVGFDYVVLDFIFRNPNASIEQIYAHAQKLITSQGDDKFGYMIWANKRFAPQVDLFKIYHMDNVAKSTSLKALQINMRARSVVDLPFPVGTVLTQQQTEQVLIPYNIHDVSETKQFAKLSIEPINFRLSLIPEYDVDVMNWNDTKIGEKLMEKRLGDHLCYDRSSGKRRMRQTPRNRIALKDIIFPYVHFDHPEFNRILDYLKAQVLTSEDMKEFASESGNIKTKGVFAGLTANVEGIEYKFGTGGIHGSVTSQKIVATDEWLIRDIDVAALYPSVAVVNRLSPEHMGERFTEEYANLPKERKKWQSEKGKKCVEANALKLAANGVYGKSNSKFSVFFDPQFTMSITINGQLLLAMLVEKLITVPTLRVIQANTDGITYYIHREYEPAAAEICKQWQSFTMLTLEDVSYSRMWIRDVNNYVAEGMDGKLKLKGAYWSPDPLNYHADIGAQQPPAWHKDLSNCVSTQAALAAMVHGVPPEQFIPQCTNPYDFMCRIKVKKSDELYLNGVDVQKTSRYYVAKNGGDMVKVAPPSGPEGRYKRKPGITEAEYLRVMNETGWQWDARVNTGKANDPSSQTKYEQRNTSIQAGYKVAICNHVDEFRFDNINYDWYIEQAKKLIIL